jgi:hypothetical protein
VNLGGEPERDDSGLPPVDIVVPDDARELERDVQAYRREQRALRRQQRRLRWHGPLTRDGVILPLLASCLILALIAGTLLTFFTARPGGESAGAPRPAGTARAGSAASPAASGQPGSSATPAAGDFPRAVLSPVPFPAGITLTVGGTTVRHAYLTGAAFALVPAGCGCGAVLAELVAQAADANVTLYLVGGAKLASATDISALVASADGQGATVAQDAHGTLASTYLPPAAIAQGQAPSALLVAPDGTVSVARSLPDGFRLTGELHALAAVTSTAATGTAG